MLDQDDLAAVQRVAFDTSPDALVVLEHDGTVAHVNHAARELACRADVLETLRGDANWLPFRVDLRTRGRALTEIRSGDRIIAVEGRRCASRLVLFLRDVTAEREAEQDVVRLWALASVGAFAASFVHDFGNLITPLTALGDALSHSVPREGIAGAVVDELQHTTESARELVASVRSMLRGRPTTAREITVNEAIDTCRPLIDRAVGPDVKVVYALDSDEAVITVDRVQFERGLLNLIANARNAMPTGGKITVRTFSALSDGTSYVGLSVTDDGVGMSPEECGRAHEPNGSGLGLWLVHRFVRNAGGKLVILSEVGEGTRVTLYLPRALRSTGNDPYRTRESAEYGWAVLDVGT